MERALEEADPEPTLQDLYFLGRAVAANILTVYRPYTGSPELTRYLNHICQAIVINNPAIGLFSGCWVLILDSPEFNAFASPGGHIFITKGFIEVMSSEDMLAAIIAHELAHIKLKHGMKVIEERLFDRELRSLSQHAIDSSREPQRAQRLMDFRATVEMLTDTMLRSGYYYSQEIEADQEALSLLAATGYDPGALTEALNVLREKQLSAGIVINATHPSPVERIRNIETWVRYYPVQDTRRYRAARFMNH